MTTQTAPFRPTAFGPVDVQSQTRSDGCVILQSNVPLAPVPRCFTSQLVKQAHAAPAKGARVCVARRTRDGTWQTLSYAQVLEEVEKIALALLQRGLNAERTLVILSENSLEHYLLALAALHIGVPYAPISPPYSLVSQDFGKLRHCLQLMTPGMVFASDSSAYARALAMIATEFPQAEIVSGPSEQSQGPVPATPFQTLIDTPLTPASAAAVAEAHARVGPETVAKVLFTSGSTSLPKGVINTHGMWCANLTQIMQTLPCLTDSPVFMDWLPWNHTFGGNHNVGLALFNGGSLYIDDGRPTPGGILQTVTNLHELAPTAYFNVPKGFEMLVPHLRSDEALRRTFFSQLEIMFYAGASLAQPVWDALEDLAAKTIGARVPIITGLGMTESGPSAMFANWPGSYSGLLGCPVPGLQVKLVPLGDKTEVRYRGPNVTPGYWRQGELTATAFDEEGFFRTGDAVRLVDVRDANKGLVFDGRIAEDFKLDTGTWVNVGVLRGRFAAAGVPIIQDSVLTGIDQAFVGAIVFLNLSACRELIQDRGALSDEAVLAHAAVRGAVLRAMHTLASGNVGSAACIRRAVIASAPLSIDLGEVTDKGSLNQRLIRQHRAALIEELYAPRPLAHIICLEEKVT